MSNDALTIAYEVLDLLADLSSRMARLAAVCRLKREVRQAVPGCHVARYRDAEKGEIKSFECYVEVQTRSDRSITWWMEIKFAREYCVVERAVFENVPASQETLVEFPDAHFNSLEEFQRDVSRLSSELAASLETVSL